MKQAERYTNRWIGPSPSITPWPEDRPVDMIEEGIDLVIRVNTDQDESLVGRAFLHDRLVVVARLDMRRPPPGALFPAVVRSAADRAA